MKKTNFVAIAQTSGIYFITSYWNKKLEVITDALNGADVNEYKTPERFRTLQNSTLSNLKFKMQNNGFSYLNLSGSDTSIFQVNGFTVVHTDYDDGQTNDCIYILNN